MRSPLILLSLGLLTSAVPVKRALPTPVSVATAKTFLSELTVAVDSNVPAYSRDLFKTWDIISGTCDTRETVLMRDGTNVVTNSACNAVSGNWFSVYDDVTTTDSSTFDIDHFVPLKEAWVSGARSWTDAQREAFANDLTRPQLIAVSSTSNESKGDRDPAQWMPPDSSFHCIYVRAWITVKQFYGLTVDSAEKSALTTLINQC
ncbi:hypothetical protein EDB85DRAFT_1913959 [Lactarius pseudohatsudake]|nr:hypothetical protein EDB85DRAFT_1913959 [Lactarius pseudohatsudake]